MEDKQELSQEQLDSRQDELERGTAFEEMTKTKGFDHVKAYYQAKLTLFINDIFNQDKKPLSEFEGQRSELVGLKRLMAEIDYSIKGLQDEQNKTR